MCLTTMIRRYHKTTSKSIQPQPKIQNATPSSESTDSTHNFLPPNPHHPKIQRIPNLRPRKHNLHPPHRNRPITCCSGTCLDCSLSLQPGLCLHYDDPCLDIPPSPPHCSSSQVMSSFLEKLLIVEMGVVMGVIYRFRGVIGRNWCMDGVVVSVLGE